MIRSSVEAPVLRSARLTLGPILPEYFETFAATMAGERARFVGGPMSREVSWRQFATEIGHWGMRGYGNFAVTETASGDFIGLIGPWSPEGWPEPEIGWLLLDGYTGKGYAAEAGARARDWAYETLGWTTTISLIDERNSGSIGVAKRLGAKFERSYAHPRFGELQVWRHPSPAQLAAQANDNVVALHEEAAT